jgi:outer membrane protein assembly factor BamB
MITIRHLLLCLLASTTSILAADDNWPQFRGSSASGVSAIAAPAEFTIDPPTNVRFKIPIPGLGHSAPAIWGDRIFLTTAVPVKGGDENLRTGLYGDIEPVADDAEYRFLLLCIDKNTGKQLWERECHRGVPKIKRHPKSSHANCTPAVDGTRVLAFFGSEGLYAFDLDGAALWKKDFGVLDSGFFVVPDAQWGFASSPVLFEDKAIVLADVQKDSFIASLDAKNGEQIWRTQRNDVPTWDTPTVARSNDRTQILVNGYHEIAGYDFSTGKQLWKMNNGGDIPVPTPIVAHDLAFITGAHGPFAPIYAIKLSAAGDISLPLGTDSSDSIPWSIRRGGNYMQTPIVVGDLLYACRDNGVLTCFEAKTGKQLYRQRLDGNGFTASPVAAGDRIYFTSEDGRVHVIKAGKVFGVMGESELRESCLATPALSNGTIYFRTQKHLIAIANDVD